MAPVAAALPHSRVAWVEAPEAERRYAAAPDHLRDLARRDQHQAAEERAWLRSGVTAAAPEQVVRDPRAQPLG
jgi:hypothetical protein